MDAKELTGIFVSMWLIFTAFGAFLNYISYQQAMQNASITEMPTVLSSYLLSAIPDAIVDTIVAALISAVVTIILAGPTAFRVVVC